MALVLTGSPLLKMPGPVHCQRQAVPPATIQLLNGGRRNTPKHIKLMVQAMQTKVASADDTHNLL